MMAADAAYDAIKNHKDGPVVLNSYEDAFKSSWVHDELKSVRNFHPSFQWGTIPGLMLGGLSAFITKGKEPWTLHHKAPDNAKLKPASECKRIEYPKPDGVISFDLLTNLARSGTNHNEDQPPHLKLRNPSVALDVNLKVYH